MSLCQNRGEQQWQGEAHVRDSQLHRNAPLQRTTHSGYSTSRGHILLFTDQALLFQHALKDCVHH
jgi:hypothetical protein